MSVHADQLESAALSAYVLGAPNVVIPRDTAVLIAVQLRELLSFAKRYASECAECGGTGDGRIVRSVQGGEIVETALACGGCKDIRDAIAKAGAK